MFFVDYLLVFILQHYVPLAMLLISFFSTMYCLLLWIYYGPIWSFTSVFYGFQAVLFNRMLWNTLPGAIRYVRPQWNYIGEDMPLYPNVWYWDGTKSRYPDDDEDEGSNAPVDKDEETDGDAG